MVGLLPDKIPLETAAVLAGHPFIEDVDAFGPQIAYAAPRIRQSQGDGNVCGRIFLPDWSKL